MCSVSVYTLSHSQPLLLFLSSFFTDDCASQLKKSAQALSHQQEQALGQLSSFDSYFSTSLPSSSSSFTPSSTYHAPFSKSVTSSTLPSSVVTPPSPIITVSSLPPPSSPSFQLSPSVLDQAHPKTLLRHASLPFLLDTTRLHPFDVAPSPTSPTSPSSPISAFSRLKKSPSWFPPFQRKNPGTLSTVSYTSSISINSTYTFDGPGASPEPEKQLRKARSFSFTQHSSTNNKNNNNNTNNNNSNTSENVFKRVMKLTRNQSIPLSLKESFTDTTLRKSNSNVFSFPVLKMNRTASDKSNSGELLHDYSVTQIPATSVPLFKSRPRTSSTATVPLAPIIACIKRGNFMRLTDIDMDALLKDMKEKNSTIFENYVLTSLVISESDAKILARLIKSSEGNMRTFKLDRCAVSQSAYKILLDACTHNKTITSLTINRSVVNDKIMRYLSKMLAKNNMIKELDISNNRITAQGIEHLADALALNKTLTRLCLQSNNIKRAGAPFLASILIKNRVIRHLNAGSNGLGAEGVAEIAESIKYNRALNSLSLDLNEMGPQGAAALAKALFTNRHLTHLYVPHNNIGDQGVHDLCRSLEHNQFLISLDLEFNHIGNNQNLVGMQALAKVLKTNTRLREINLAFNTLAPEAIQALMEGLSVNSTLESIMFTNCGISTEGAMAIAKVLPSTKGLQNLGLTANPDIGVEGYWALATGLEKNQFLKGIQLDYNSADRHALYESIQNSLTRNYVWQRTVYMAACRIMVLSRIVLLGQPVQQRSLQSYMQQHQQLYWLQQQEQQVDETEDSDNSENAQQKSSSGLGWSLRRKVNKMERQLSGGSSPTSSFFKGKNTTNVSRILSNGSDTGFFEHEQEPENTSHSNLHSRQGSLAISGSSNNNSAMSSPLLTQYPAMGSSHHHEMNSLNEPPKHHQLSQAPTHGYNAHKVLANMSNMPYEIFETICAFLDTERTMNLAQIRSAIQVGGTRSSLFPGAPVHHTREKMMEQVFHTRYISSVGVRYSVKAGDERI